MRLKRKGKFDAKEILIRKNPTLSNTRGLVGVGLLMAYMVESRLLEFPIAFGFDALN